MLQKKLCFVPIKLNDHLSVYIGFTNVTADSSIAATAIVTPAATGTVAATTTTALYHESHRRHHCSRSCDSHRQQPLTWTDRTKMANLR